MNYEKKQKRILFIKHRVLAKMMKLWTKCVWCVVLIKQ